MLLSDLHVIGNKLLKARKAAGLTQAEVAELSELSDRTYADIERGEANMRIGTMLKICKALAITPNDIFVDGTENIYSKEELDQKINQCSESERETALKLLSIYVDSIKR